MIFETISDINRLARKRGKPFYAYFEPTFKCNLKCLHCFADYPHYGKELSFAEIVSLLNQLAKAGTLFVDFSGGEPFMRKDFIDILESARKLDFAITILTNATLITEELADRISYLSPRLIKITLYGATEEMYQKTTGKAHLFHRAIEGIRLLAKHKLSLSVASPIFNFYTVKEVSAIEKICDELGVVLRKFTQFGIRNNGDLAPLKYNLSESQLEEFSRAFPGLRDSPINKRPKIKINEKVCDDLCGSIYINPYGQIGNCDKLVSKISVRERPLLEIWQNDSLLKKQREFTWKDMPDCLLCKSFYYCKPCPGVNLVSTGSFNKIPAFFCRSAHMLRRVSEKLSKLPVDR